MHVHILARAPIPGRCKTRLIPRLGVRGAAWVQRRLIERALVTATEAARPGDVRLWGAPHARHAFFVQCRGRQGVHLGRQSRGNLGQRMRQALGRQPGLLIGADAFELVAGDLQRAWQAIAHTDFVLLPAPDGGYVLIGARGGLPRLDGIAWSSGRECAQTARRLLRHGSLTVLEPFRRDFDDAADWRRARRLGAMPPLVHRR